MSKIEKMRRYISKRESGEFPLGTRYQMCLSELMALAHMNQVDAVCLVCDYGRAKGYRAAKAEVRCGDKGFCGSGLGCVCAADIGSAAGGT